MTDPAETLAVNWIRSPQQMEAVCVGTVVRSASGTIACRYNKDLAVLFGDDRPIPFHHALTLPLQVLWDPRHPTSPDPKPDALRERLCSQCGERTFCMVKVSTQDGWCEICLDEAAEVRLRERVEALAVEWERAADRLAPGAMAPKEPQRYLSTGEVAERIGVKPDTIHAYHKRGQMPAPDAVIGNRAGWLPSTIDAWDAKRPSKFYAKDED